MPFMRHKFLVLTVKKFLKSMNIYGSYRKIKMGYNFFGPLCRISSKIKVEHNNYQ